MLQRCSLIKNMDVKYDDEHHLVIIENRILDFSPTEYKLIQCLLIHGIVSEKTLLEKPSTGYTESEASQLISKYMNRVRNKVKAFGIQISRIHDYGYILLLPNHVICYQSE